MAEFTQPQRLAVARKFDISLDEIVVVADGAVLDGMKAIYSPTTERAYMLPPGITGAITSLSAAGILTYAGGTVDLGALAVSRGEYFNTNQTFTSGVTLQA